MQTNAIQVVNGFGSAQCDFVGHVDTLKLKLNGATSPVDIRIGCRVETLLHDGVPLVLDSFDYDLDAPIITVSASGVNGSLVLELEQNTEHAEDETFTQTTLEDKV